MVTFSLSVLFVVTLGRVCVCVCVCCVKQGSCCCVLGLETGTDPSTLGQLRFGHLVFVVSGHQNLSYCLMIFSVV